MKGTADSGGSGGVREKRAGSPGPNPLPSWGSIALAHVQLLGGLTLAPSGHGHAAQYPERASADMVPQFPHLWKEGSRDLRTEGKSWAGSAFHKDPDARISVPKLPPPARTYLPNTTSIPARIKSSLARGSYLRAPSENCGPRSKSEKRSLPSPSAVR